jgi:DNA polymerase III delta prime subunit
VDVLLIDQPHVLRRIVIAGQQLNVIFLDPLRLLRDAVVGARRKQYEYYRDKLLTFEEATA